MPPPESLPAKPAVSTQTGSTQTGSRVLAVINSASGNADPNAVDPVLGLLNQRLGERDIEVQVIAFAPDTLAESLHDALGEDVRAIYVAGGDGTLLSVVEALDGHRVPIGIIPRGTMNWMAKDLGIPLDLEDAVTALLDARVQTVDIGCVNGESFLCACMVGVGPLVARWRERERRTPPWQRWPKLLWRALRLLRSYPHRRMTLVTGAGRERLRSRTVVVTSNLLDASFGPLPRRMRLDGGVLGIYAVRKTSARELARLLTRLMLGSWQADDALLTATTSEASLAVSGRGAITVMLDGEIRRLKTPLRFSIKPDAVAMLVPVTSPT
ncbi:hypothetical protein G3480_04070 [Thiorhodococcus mannitoliphagus]|uniref:DAGKc domain-containing protein n=1 Tax=Thiorhodococcus mannitoliphagus TaxID=329406 RepID=A0A6P1DN92_9GAMM|nr:diacylglycerol kinase family protein [Thiorhodococcus mannitoliphagus]NEX19498.1 hypothetical protein [Thiorhodococcus mannitoliphagus]